jgi:hypothetical protein
LRRIILANAARTASVLVRCLVSGAGGAVSSPVSPVAFLRADGIIGCISVGAKGPRSIGCIPIGPVLSEVRFLWAMKINARRPFSFRPAVVELITSGIGRCEVSENPAEVCADGC